MSGFSDEGGDLRQCLRERNAAEKLNRELLEALKACRTNIAGYNLRDGSVARELVDEFFNELQRIHKVASAAIAKVKP